MKQASKPGTKTGGKKNASSAVKVAASPPNGTDPVSDGMPVLIKKYPNRRLYNTSTSSYIVLDDVIELVKAGTEFVIEDTKSKQDITRSILNQIIYEQETKPSDFHFPLEVQKQLISMYGDNYGKMVPDYLTESLRLFASERQQLADAVGSVLNRNTKAVLDYSQALAQQNMELFKRSVSMFTGGATGGASSSSSKPDAGHTRMEAPIENGADGGERDTALKDIQNQIDALQERLKQLK
ncbi:MAG: polyhydroxyalkanoate synthesis repressor PhaR [Pseudomonadota bacterium]